MENTFYFAGTMVQSAPDAPEEFEVVCCFGTSLPYLTKSICGLKSTARYANLYALSDDLTRATLADIRIDTYTPEEVVLTDEQREMLKEAIELNIFYS